MASNATAKEYSMNIVLYQYRTYFKEGMKSLKSLHSVRIDNIHIS